MSATSTLKRPAVRARIFGAAMIAIGLLLLLCAYIYGHWELFVMLAIGSFFLGLFAIVLITEKVVPGELSEAMQLGAMQNNHRLIQGLSLAGCGTYVPIFKGGKAKDVRVFIPLKERPQERVPEADDVFQTGTGDTAMGMTLTPPGLALMRKLEMELDISFSRVGVQELEQYLRSEALTASLIKDVNLKVDLPKKGAGKARLIVSPREHLELCQKADREYMGLCKTLGCPICSSLLCALCLSSGKKVRIASALWNGKKGEMTYELALEG